MSLAVNMLLLVLLSYYFMECKVCAFSLNYYYYYDGFPSEYYDDDAFPLEYYDHHSEEASAFINPAALIKVQDTDIADTATTFSTFNSTTSEPAPEKMQSTTTSRNIPALIKSRVETTTENTFFTTTITTTLSQTDIFKTATTLSQIYNSEAAVASPTTSTKNAFFTSTSDYSKLATKKVLPTPRNFPTPTKFRDTTTENAFSTTTKKVLPTTSRNLPTPTNFHDTTTENAFSTITTTAFLSQTNNPESGEASPMSLITSRNFPASTKEHFFRSSNHSSSPLSFISLVLFNVVKLVLL